MSRNLKDDLIKWSQGSPQAKAMYAYLMSRKRGTRGGKPSDLRHIVMRLIELGYTLSQGQVEAELVKLEALGIGSLERKTGRRPKWAWIASPAAVSKLLNSGPAIVPSVIEAPPIANGPGPSTIKQRHVVTIRRGETTIEASPEDLAEVMLAIGMR